MKQITYTKSSKSTESRQGVGPKITGTFEKFFRLSPAAGNPIIPSMATTADRYRKSGIRLDLHQEWGKWARSSMSPRRPAADEKIANTIQINSLEDIHKDCR
jgi:hypothetical protein